MNWPLLVSIVIPIMTLLIGALLNRFLERKAKLITYLGHASVFEVHPTPGTTQYIHTHSIVVSNAGGKAANNVRISHRQLPDYYIHPAVPHRVEDIPQGGKDIVIPVMVPGQQITVSYLYAPPVTWNLINEGTRSDEGFAHVHNVIQTRQFSQKTNYFFAYLMIAGCIATLYLLILLFIKILSLIR